MAFGWHTKIIACCYGKDESGTNTQLLHLELRVCRLVGILTTPLLRQSLGDMPFRNPSYNEPRTHRLGLGSLMIFIAGSNLDHHILDHHKEFPSICRL